MALTFDSGRYVPATPDLHVRYSHPSALVALPYRSRQHLERSTALRENLFPEHGAFDLVGVQVTPNCEGTTAGCSKGCVCRASLRTMLSIISNVINSV